MKLLIFFLLAFSYHAYAGCVRSYCADGYDGCGCGPDSAECCRKRLTGNDSNTSTPGLDMQIYEKGMELIKNNIQLQQQKQKMQLQMMQEGDTRIGKMKYQEGEELDIYHDKQNKERIKKNNEIKSIKDQLIGLDKGFQPLKIENSLPQTKYTQQAEKKYGRKLNKKMLEAGRKNTEQNKSNSVAPKPCNTSSIDYPNRCITTACGMSSSESLCCPKDFAYLNHCDCQCYESTDFSCGAYSSCQHYKEN